MGPLSWSERLQDGHRAPPFASVLEAKGAPLDFFLRLSTPGPCGGGTAWVHSCFKEESVDSFKSCRRPFGGDPESSYRPAVQPGGSMAKTPADVTPRKRDPAPRPRNMSAADVDRVVEVVRHWPKAPITWKAIREALSSDLPRGAGRRAKPAETWTRQTLSANARIKAAYDARRAELAAKGNRKRRPVDPEATILRQRVETLEIQLKAAREENEAFANRYRTLLVNRAMRVPEDEVEAPLLPKVDRTERKG